VSLPLPYGDKHSGVEREPPASGGPRPYADRLRDAPDLVEKVGPSRNSVVSALPSASAVLLVAGAAAPVAFAHPDIREQFFQPLVEATDPLSIGLAFAADAVYYGWQGAAMLLVAALLGFVAWRVASGESALVADRSRVTTAAAVIVLVAGGAAVGVFGLALADPLYSAVAAWVVITGGAGAYGAWQAQGRRDWQASIGGAAALLMGGRFVLGGLALVCLALGDKEFPGQSVAPYSWRRSQVGVGVVRPAPGPEYQDLD
jgi:hypothetical protein